jgi:hypothetical protein
MQVVERDSEKAEQKESYWGSSAVVYLVSNLAALLAVLWDCARVGETVLLTADWMVESLASC